MKQITAPFPLFVDRAGDPLDAGYVYIGAVNQNPETSPIAVYWDEAGTQPAAQPLRTSAGRIVNGVTPARVYLASEDYSMTVKDNAQRVVLSVLDVDSVSGLVDRLASASAAVDGAGMVGFGASQSYAPNTVGDELKPRFTWGSPYLQTLSDIQNGDNVSLWRFIDKSKHAGIRAATNSDDLSSDIQDALDSGAYAITIPVGSYNIDSELTINTNGVRLIGSGPERTKFIQRTGGQNGIISNSAIARLLWCEVSNLRIEMPGGTSGSGIWIRNPEVFKGHFLRVTTLSSTKTTGYGIRIERESDSDFGYYVEINQSHVDKCATGVFIGGQNPGAANGHLLDFVISNNNTDYGIHISNNSGTFVRNCAAELNDLNVRIDGGFAVQVESGRFERPKTHNVFISSGQAHKVCDALIASAGHVNTSTGRGVYIAAGQFARIENNVFQEGFSSFDVEVASGVENACILDNCTKTITSAWSAGAPRVLDNGTKTIKRHITNTASNYGISSESDTRFSSGALIIGAAQTRLYSGSGTPEGVVSATVGSIYLREDGGVSTTLYVKTSGTGNTGWTAK